MNIQLGSLTLGWREMVLAAVVMLGVYMLFVAWLMRRLRRHALPKSVPVEPSVQAAAGAAAYAANAAAGEVEPSLSEVLAPTPTPTEQGEVVPDDARQPEPAAGEDLQRQLAQMREELDALRAEFSALRADVQHEAAQLKAQQAVSPLYSDAMKMAGAGHDATVIAERCGISRAEAELVVALVKSQD